MKETIIPKTPKYSVQIRQTAKGVYYLGSLSVNGETLEEIENSVDSALLMITSKIQRLNTSKSKAKDQDYNLNPEDMELFERLRQLRLNISIKENVPPYVVFHDSVLKYIAKYRPKTKEEILKVPGIAQRKFEKYGELFLKVVSEFKV